MTSTGGKHGGLGFPDELFLPLLFLGLHDPNMTAQKSEANELNSSCSDMCQCMVFMASTLL